MEIAGRTLAGGWRFDQLEELPEECRYEVVDGSLVVSPPPTPWHQFAGATLLTQLTRQCPVEWRVLYELGLLLGTDGRVPDLAVISAGAALRSRFVPPEDFGLVVEIVSPSSRKTDRFAKPGEYAEAGIPLFWRVETEAEPTVVVYRLESRAYVEQAVVRRSGPVPVPWGSAEIDLTVLCSS